MQGNYPELFITEWKKNMWNEYLGEVWVRKPCRISYRTSCMISDSLVSSKMDFDHILLNLPRIYSACCDQSMYREWLLLLLQQ